MGEGLIGLRLRQRVIGFKDEPEVHMRLFMICWKFIFMRMRIRMGWLRIIFG